MSFPDRVPPSSPEAPGIFGPPRIGRYELCAELASGGMGRVYLARARGPAGFEKLVALKCIHPELAGERAFVEMFFDEARIAARIAHPNVCGVFDFGEADGRYFIAMEYLVGEPLSRLTRKLAGRPPPDGYDALVARIVAEAAEGLHAAHELAGEDGRPLGVVHRDVSPQNIFLTYDGGVRVVDFGIASAEGRLHQTTTGAVKGKFAYMSPEQMRREKVDRRADVWALGVVLWELLARRRLFKASGELDIMLAVLNDPVPSPRELRPEIDPELDAIVMGALAKDREARTATARELARALQRWIVGRGAVVGMAELAALMESVFTEERAAAQELVERARRTDPTAELERALPPPAEPAVAEIEVAVVDPAPPRRPLMWAGLAAVLLLALAGGWWIGRGGAPPASAASPPRATERSDREPERAPAAVAAVPSAPEGAPPARVDPPAEAEPSDRGEPERGPAAVAAAPGAPEDAQPSQAPPADAEGSGRPARRRESEPAPSTGRLIVRVRGPAEAYADVYADGRRIGRTPYDGALPTGPALIELRPYGLAPLPGDTRMRRRVTIGRRPTRIVVSLDSP